MLLAASTFAGSDLPLRRKRSFQFDTLRTNAVNEKRLFRLVQRTIPMELQLLDYTLEDLQLCERTALVGKSLSVSVADLQEQIQDPSHGIHIDYELARPGEPN